MIQRQRYLQPFEALRLYAQTSSSLTSLLPQQTPAPHWPIFFRFPYPPGGRLPLMNDDAASTMWFDSHSKGFMQVIDLLAHNPQHPVFEHTNSSTWYQRRSLNSF
jgi:hypothetical protein